MSFVPPRRARWVLLVFGALLCAQGLAKALDATGYMAALDAFHMLRPAALAPLSLGALALAWTVLELLAGVAMLYGGLSRTPAKQLTQPRSGVTKATRENWRCGFAAPGGSGT